jgi:hypothetical protein
VSWPLVLFVPDKKKEMMMRERSSSFSHLQSPKFKRKPANMVPTILKIKPIKIKPHKPAS